MKTNQKTSKGFTLVELLVVIAIIATLAGIATPMILNARKAGDRTQAVSNAKQLGLALIEFDTEFGSFPDNITAQEVQEVTQSPIQPLLGAFSNDFFRQLLAYGIQSEEIFYAKTTYTRKPDNVILNNQALEPGEVGFGYVMPRPQVGMSTAGNPGLPVAVAPLVQGGQWTFERDTYANKAVILRLDNSVSSPLIRESDNRVSVGGGNTLESVGPQTVWGPADVPTLMPPTPRGGGN